MEVAPHRELHAVRVQVAEEIVAPPGVRGFRGVRRVHRDPPAPGKVELGPAVIAGDRPLRLRFQGKADDEPGGNAFGPGERHEEGVEVRAVALRDVAGPLRVAVAPARSRLVVDHRVHDVIVDGVGLGFRGLVAVSDAPGELAHPGGKRDELLFLKRPLDDLGALVPAGAGEPGGENLLALGLEAHADLELPGLRLVGRDVVVAVPELLLRPHGARIGAVHPDVADSLG